jgi:hypothetical protein
MTDIEEFLSLLNISEDEALDALVSAFSPTPPPTVRQNWNRLSTFGNSSPSSEEIWNLMCEGDFKCTLCGSHRRITIDHINSDASDHSKVNLVLLCYSCNRGRAKRATVDYQHALRIYKSTMALEKSLGRFPELKEIKGLAKVGQIGSATYLVKFLKAKLGYKDA